jgi:hypothetical protein
MYLRPLYSPCIHPVFHPSTGRYISPVIRLGWVEGLILMVMLVGIRQNILIRLVYGHLVLKVTGWVENKTKIKEK